VLQWVFLILTVNSSFYFFFTLTICIISPIIWVDEFEFEQFLCPWKFERYTTFLLEKEVQFACLKCKIDSQSCSLALIHFKKLWALFLVNSMVCLTILAKSTNLVLLLCFETYIETQKILKRYSSFHAFRIFIFWIKFSFFLSFFFLSTKPFTETS